jgi:type III secretion protein X
MPDLNISNLSLDYGISSIVYARKEETGDRQLPERHDLPPSADGVRAQLDELLDQPNTESFLESSLKPEIGNRELLMPAKFSQALSDALTSLTAAAENAGEDAKPLNRALRLLKEESGLRDLVSMYRSALYQG